MTWFTNIKRDKCITKHWWYANELNIQHNKYAKNI